ncbi:hypothetical protein V1511DRAFT_458897 [Dipodascopsis uninucleata]
MAFLSIRKRGHHGASKAQDLPSSGGSGSSASNGGGFAATNKQPDSSSLREHFHSHSSGYDSNAGTNTGSAMTVSTTNSHTAPPNSSSSASPSSPRIHYPWADREISSPITPFPRYGHSCSNIPSKSSGGIILFGGLKGEESKNDLWSLDPEKMTMTLIQNHSDVVSPRYGHSSAIAGNAFVVFGGDTRESEEDPLDDNLYFLNTATFKWSIAAVHGARPVARYGHAMAVIGTRLYVFGGQVDGFFFNDLLCFDLGVMQESGVARWELVKPKTANVPAARTNHTMVAYKEKLIVFGGTNSLEWFNDTWCFDTQTGIWAEVHTVGYVPKVVEGHRAIVVNGFMYIFGGRSKEGRNLQDLGSLKLSSQRWYRFQNMGPAPSARSGHSLSIVGSKIFVLGGHPESGQGTDLNLVYTLDTMRIKYPAEQSDLRVQKSVDNLQQSHLQPSSDGLPEGPLRYRGVDAKVDQRTLQALNQPKGNGTYSHRPANQKQPHVGMTATQYAHRSIYGPQRAEVEHSADPVDESSVAPMQSFEEPQLRSQHSSPELRNSRSLLAHPGQSSLRYQKPPYDIQGNDNSVTRPVSLSPRSMHFGTDIADKLVEHDSNRDTFTPFSKMPYNIESKNEPQTSMEVVLSTEDEISDVERHVTNKENESLDKLTELESLRRTNKWLKGELVRARQAGYKLTSASDYAHFEIEFASAQEGTKDLDYSLLQAILAMKADLEQVRKNLYNQVSEASERMSQVEKQRDDIARELQMLKAKNLQRQSIEASQAINPVQLAENQQLREDLEVTQTEVYRLRQQLLSVQEDLERETAAHKDTANKLKETSTEATKVTSQTTDGTEELHIRIAELEEKLASITKENISLRNFAEEAKSKSDDLQIQLAQAEYRKAEIEVEVEALFIKIDELQGDLQAQRELQAVLEQEKQEVFLAAEQVKKGIDEISRRSENLDKQLKLTRNARFTAESKLQACQAELSELQAKLEIAESRLEGSGQSEFLSKDSELTTDAALDKLNHYLGKINYSRRTSKSSAFEDLEDTTIGAN